MLDFSTRCWEMLNQHILLSEVGVMLGGRFAPRLTLANIIRTFGHLLNCRSFMFLNNHAFAVQMCLTDWFRFFLLFYCRELTSTFVKLKSLVQRAKETLEENIIELYKEITRLEKIENDAKILR